MRVVSMFSYLNPADQSSQAKTPPERTRWPDDNRTFLLIGWSLDHEELTAWEDQARTRDGLRLRHVLDVYPHGVPEAVVTRYGLKDDFRRLQAFRGRMSGLWRRVRTAGRDAEICRLVRLGNSMRAVADIFHVSASLVHYVVHRRIERFPSSSGQSSVQVVRPRSVMPESCISRHERSLSLKSGSLNTKGAWLKIVENMMIQDGFRPPDQTILRGSNSAKRTISSTART